MSKAPADAARGELNVAARRVLLNALDALKDQNSALVLVGAQAVYLRTESAALTGIGYTSDADLAVDPRQLIDEPLLEQAMLAAGFVYSGQPGTWRLTQTIAGKDVPVMVDLMVPDKLMGGGRSRGGRIPPHDNTATRRSPGLEAAAFDYTPLLVGSLEPEADPRTHTLNVAGPTALLIAKAFKIRDRLADAERKPERLSDKDAGDVIRLMMTSGDISETFQHLEAEEQIAEVVREGRELLTDQFGSARGAGVDMAVRALDGDMPAERVRLLAPNYITAYLN
jgi:hypothetical protein